MKGGFVFAAEPQPVGVLNRTKPKYRDAASAANPNVVAFETQVKPIEDSNNCNIMIDKRVVRGSTYGAHSHGIISVNRTQPKIHQSHDYHGNFKARHDPNGTKYISRSLKPRNAPYLLSSPRSLNPYIPEEKSEYQFKNEIFTQTDALSKERDGTMVEKDAMTQTDFPCTEQEEEERRQQKLVRNIFFPYPRGVDASTEILDGELFCWEDAIENILEVVVGKSLDQALIEVREEEEYSKWEAQRDRFARERDELLAETQRLENEAIRREAEKSQRILQREKRMKELDITKQKHQIMKLAQNFAISLQEQAWKTLEDEGAFTHCIDTDVRNKFLPMLTQMISSQFNAYKTTRDTLDATIYVATLEIAEKRKD
jgi:hypothetical protein